MKKILMVMLASLMLVGCSSKTTETPKDKDINTLPDVEGNENVSIDSDGNKINNSSAFTSKKTYDVYEITNGALSTTADGRTTFKANVKNTSDTEKAGGLVDIILVDNKKNKVSKLPTYIRTLKAGETMELNASISKDLSNAYDYYFANHEV